MPELTTADKDFIQIQTLVHGIADGKWDVNHVLSEFCAMISCGWDVNYKYNPQYGFQTISALR